MESTDIEKQLGSTKIGDWPNPGQISDDNVAIVGHDDFLFLHQGSNAYFDAYSSANDDLKLARSWASAFQSWRQRIEAMGCKFCVAIVPNKATLLPELYPLPLANKMTARMSELANLADPRDLAVFHDFMARSDKKAIFRRNDSHLTDWGSRLLTDFVKTQFGMPVQTWNFDANALGSTQHKGDLGGRLPTQPVEKLIRFKHDWGQFEILDPTEANSKGGFVGIGYHSKNTKRNDGSKMLAFGNSFIERIPSWGAAPWLANSVSDFHFSWRSGIDFDLVEKVRPDVVVFQTCERFLHREPAD